MTLTLTLIAALWAAQPPAGAEAGAGLRELDACDSARVSAAVSAIALDDAVRGGSNINIGGALDADGPDDRLAAAIALVETTAAQVQANLRAEIARWRGREAHRERAGQDLAVGRMLAEYAAEHLCRGLERLEAAE